MRYQVQSGDSLSKIAKKFYGESSQYLSIAEANGIESPYTINIGQWLEIPGVSEQESEIDAKTELPKEDASLAKTSSDENTSNISADLLQQIMPSIAADTANQFAAPLSQGMMQAGINTPLRQSHFIAQLAHESGSFKFLIENLNYSESALNAVFGKYFSDDKPAADYARKPEAIANCVYADRMGNGDESSGDGWRYRGRGLIQLTGKSNYQSLSEYCGEDYVANPELIADSPEGAVTAAIWYWQSRHLNDYADKDDIETITKRINGGLNGLDDRKLFLTNAKTALNIA
ncbi:MAG: LysM peptidoglycan-binding domain-containing protein [Cellvibrionales bacterium]|nr:LysM peptidoglycan-binding domain-containing protein [Cellvibrionales bacterium]